MDPSRALLHNIVDYAGLFPPASLGMGEAVRNYAQYRRGEQRWMLGPFVLPVARLDELVGGFPPMGSLSDARDLRRATAVVAEHLPEVLASAAELETGGVRGEVQGNRRLGRGQPGEGDQFEHLAFAPAQGVQGGSECGR